MQQDKNKGILLATDSFGNPIVLEWERIEGRSPRINDKIQEASAILTQTYTRQELEFAKAHPETVSNQHFLKPLSPLFEKGLQNVDWDEAHHQLEDSFSQIFSSSDFEQYVSDNETMIFVLAKDANTKKPMGLVQFLTTPEFPKGSVKSAYFGVEESWQNREVEKVLMSSVFRLFSDVQRIFMHTRTTNERMIRLYETWGFEKFPGTLPFWIDLEYLPQKFQFLQSAAQELAVKSEMV